jgi:hypothetical protein
VLALTALALGAGAAPAPAATALYDPGSCTEADLTSATPEALLRCYAPAFLVPGVEHGHNRIGTPVAAPGWLGTTRISVDPERPALYAEVRSDSVAGIPVLQLVYRVHFEKIPLRFSRYFFEAHRNPGLLLLVTVDEATRTPWFVTAVHSCGCYMGLMPTDRVPSDWLPNHWPQRRIDIYGKSLPARLPSFDPRRSRLQIELEPHSHRFTSVTTPAAPAGARAQEAAQAAEAALEELPLLSLGELRSLPVAGTQRSVSLFYSSGPLRGHVRGAWNPLEGLTLFGLVALDPTVGMDKDFGDPRETGTPFYTQLSFWKHGRSRLDRFDRLLRTLGFELPH